MYWNSERCRQMALPIRTVPLHMARLNPSCVLRPFLVIINQCWCISLFSIQPITDSKHSSIFLSDFQLHVTIIVCNFFCQTTNVCRQSQLLQLHDSCWRSIYFDFFPMQGETLMGELGRMFCKQNWNAPPIGDARAVPQMADTHSRTSYLSMRPLTTYSPFSPA